MAQQNERRMRQSLVTDLAPIGQLQWSPDSKRILFHTVSDTNAASDLLVPAEGGVPKERALGGGHNEGG